MKQTKELLRTSFAPELGAFHTLTIEGGHADYEHSEIELETGEVGSTFKDDEWDARAEALFGALGPFSAAAFGVQFQNREFSALGEGADYLLPTEPHGGGVRVRGCAAADATAPARRRTCRIGGCRRHAWRDISTRAVSLPSAPRPALLFDASDSAATRASRCRVPRARQDKPSCMRAGRTRPPPRSKPATPLSTWSARTRSKRSLRYDADKVRFEAAVWGAKFTNYIFGKLTGRTCDDEGRLCWMTIAGSSRSRTTRSLARRSGVRKQGDHRLLEVADAPLGGISLADYVRAKLDGAGNVPRIPPYHVGAGLTGTGTTIDGGFLVKYTGPRDDHLATAETPPPDSCRSMRRPRGVRSKSPDIEIALVGRNLTDRIQRNAVSLNKDEVILPGREVRLMVRARL